MNRTCWARGHALAGSLRASLLGCWLLSGLAAVEMRISGEILHADLVDVFGVELSDVDALPQLQGSLLTLRDLSARLYGGRVFGLVTWDFTTRTLEADLRFRSVSLSLFIRRYLAVEDWEEGGQIDGRLSIRLPARGIDGFSGSGTIQLRHGSLLALPGFANLILEGASDARGLDAGEAHFTLADGRFHLHALRIENPAVRLQVQGSIGFDGSLDLLANPMTQANFYRRAPIIGDLFANLLREITRSTFRFRITGHLDEPRIRPRF